MPRGERWPPWTAVEGKSKVRRRLRKQRRGTRALYLSRPAFFRLETSCAVFTCGARAAESAGCAHEEAATGSHDVPARVAHLSSSRAEWWLHGAVVMGRWLDGATAGEVERHSNGAAVRARELTMFLV